MTDDEAVHSVMLEIGAQLLLGLPGPERFRALHLGCVLETTEDGYVLEFELEEFPGTAGQNCRLFFQTPDGFMQQVARIEESVDGAPIPTVRVVTIGDPLSAEGRSHPRISTVASELVATVGGEAGCPVVDLSRTGLAVMGSEPRATGDIVDVVLENGPETYTGRACIQSRRELWEGRFRYGLHCCDTRDGAGTLKTGLAEVSAGLHSVAD